MSVFLALTDCKKEFEMILADYLKVSRPGVKPAALARRPELPSAERALRMRATGSAVVNTTSPLAAPRATKTPVPVLPATAPLHQLSACADVSSLSAVLTSLCTRFGAIARLDVVPMDQAGRRQAICLWRMQTPEAQERLKREWAVGCFGGDLVLVVDLAPATTIQV